MIGDGAAEALAKLDAVEKVDVKDGVATIALKKKSTLTLSAVEKAVKVDREKLVLDGKVALRLGAKGEADGPCPCEAATKALKIDGVSEVTVPKTRSGVVQGTFKNVRYSEATKALAAEKLPFEDVVWASCCGDCKPGQDCTACGKTAGLGCGGCASDCDNCKSGNCGGDCPKCGTGCGSKKP